MVEQYRETQKLLQHTNKEKRRENYSRTIKRGTEIILVEAQRETQRVLQWKNKENIKGITVDN